MCFLGRRNGTSARSRYAAGMRLPCHFLESGLPGDASGAPTDLLMVPGANGHRDWLLPLATELQGQRRVLVPTLPGEDEAPALGANPRDASMDEVVARLLATMDAYAMDRPVVFGTSFGAIVALHLALARPRRVAALILHAGTARPAQLLARWTDVLQRPLPAILVFNAILLRGLVPEMAHALGTPWGRLRTRRALALRLSIPFSPEAVGRRLQILQNVDLSLQLPQIHLPSLVLSGHDGLDSIMPPEEGYFMAARLPQAHHMVLKGTGHLAPLLATEVLASAVSSFLESLRAT